MNLTIRKGRVLDPANQLDQQTDVHVRGGKIAAVGRAPKGFEPDRVMEAEGMIVMPGVVDLSMRLRAAGQERKTDIAGELRAAARGGVTSLCHPPDTEPVMDRASVVESVLAHARKARKAHVHCLGAMTKGLAGEELAPMQQLKDAGCVAVSNACEWIGNSNTLRRCMEYANSCGLPVFLFPEEGDLRNEGVAHEGQVSTRLGLAPVPETAETVAVCRALLLAEQTGARLHFCRLSTARSVELLAAAQARDLPVTADVDICHLLLTEMDLAQPESLFNSLCHLRPPLRSRRDLEGLLRGLGEGVISAVCSDHQPHDLEAKMRPFASTEPGAACVEWLLPLMMLLVERESLSLPEAVAALTWHPARIAGIPAGTLSPDAAADICVYDPHTPSQTPSRAGEDASGQASPFDGWEFPGRVAWTLHKGQVSHEA